jgi:hypothetical protein
MPTLLDLADVPIPETVEGVSAVGEARRSFLFGECREGRSATRMIHDGRHKLIWYPAGNEVQLFDLELDSNEMHDVSDDIAYFGIRQALTRELIRNLYGTDIEWVIGEELVGYHPDPYSGAPSRTYGNQRGIHYPQPPAQRPESSGAQPG